MSNAGLGITGGVAVIHEAIIINKRAKENAVQVRNSGRLSLKAVPRTYSPKLSLQLGATFKNQNLLAAIALTIRNKDAYSVSERVSPESADIWVSAKVQSTTQKLASKQNPQ